MDDTPGKTCPTQPAPVATLAPAPGEVWIHYGGGRYVVRDLGRMERDGTPVVIYETLEPPGTVWVRPLHEWRDVVACATPRFKREVAHAD